MKPKRSVNLFLVVGGWFSLALALHGGLLLSAIGDAKNLGCCNFYLLYHNQGWPLLLRSCLLDMI
jgi:hypothetical protein